MRICAACVVSCILANHDLALDRCSICGTLQPHRDLYIRPALPSEDRAMICSRSEGHWIPATVYVPNIHAVLRERICTHVPLSDPLQAKRANNNAPNSVSPKSHTDGSCVRFCILCFQLMRIPEQFLIFDFQFRGGQYTVTAPIPISSSLHACHSAI